MATLLHGESRRLYSWWWDSHISPKNSKWLQENLTDMDVKVKAMIKLLEEDADSFARRAEMYYKKRPELMKLVEEFYRAYRALAERYDHATGALRQAHRTMAEAFPNQIPLVLSDDSTSTSPAGVEPHTPEIPAPIRALFDPDDLQKDALGISSHFHAINRNGGYSDESDSSMSKKGLKQLHEMFETGEGAARPRLPQGRVRKGLIFHQEAIKGSELKMHNGPNELQKNDLVEKEAEIKYLQEKLTRLSTENHELESRVTSETDRADRAQTEVQSLREALSAVKSEKEVALVQHQSSLERISSLEAEIARLQEESKKLNNEMIEEATKLSSAEQRCLVLEKELQSVQLELDRLEQKSKSQELELSQRHEEFEKVNGSLEVKQEQHMKAEIALQSMGKLLSKSELEVRQLALEVQANNERLNAMEQSILVLKEQVKHLKTENSNLHEQNHSSALLMRDLQDEITHLKETKGTLKDEVRLHLEGKKAIQQEVDCLKEVRKDLEQRQHDLAEELKSVSSHTDALQTLVKELKEENGVLKNTCKKHEDEQEHHLENLRQLEELSQKNSLLQVSLSDAQVELEGSRETLKILQSSCDSLHGEIALHVSEKAALVGRMDIISQNMEKLLGKNTFLENSLSDVNAELESLRERLKGSEGSCQALSDQHFNLLSEKNSLVSQVESLSLSLGNKERRYAELKEQNLILEEQNSTTLNQLRELENILTQERQEHQKHIQSSMHQQATLQDQIYLLQESARFKEEEFVVEQEKNINNDIKIFILHRYLSDLKESNSFLHTECQKHLQESIGFEKLISHLQQEDHMQKEKLAMLYKENDKLREAMHLLSNVLTINGEYGSSTRNEDKELLEIILAEIRSLQDLISDAQYENQHLQLEKLVIMTLLHQLALELANTRSERDFLEQERATTTNEFLLLQNKTSEFLELNEQLRQEMEAANEREKAQEDKLGMLCAELSDCKETHHRSQVQIHKLVADNLLLSKRSQEFEKERALWEEDINAVLVKVMEHEVSHLMFRSILAETVLELKLLLDKLDSLRADNNDFGQEMGILNKKLDLLEVENMHLKEQVICLEECERRMMALQGDLSKARDICEQQNLELESVNYLLISKDTELSVVYQKLQEVHQISREKICNLIDENHSMIEKHHTIKEKKEIVEEKNNILIREFISMECLYVIFKCLYTDMALQLQLFNDYLQSLHGINSDLNQKIRFLDEKQGMTEVENLHLKESVFILEECRSHITVLESDLGTAQSVCKQLNHQIEAGKVLFAQRETELLEESQKAWDAYHSVQGEMCTQVEDKRYLSKNLYDLKEQMNKLEQENATILAEAAALDCLYLISTSLNAEKATELKLFSDDLDYLHGINHSLDQEVKTLNNKIGKLEEENSQLWESKHHLEECRSQLQEIVQRSQGEIDKLFEENEYLSKKFNALMVKNETVEEDNVAILVEAMTMEFLQLIFRSLNAESAIELESFSNDLKHLHTVKSKLDQEVMLLNENFQVLEVENVQLKQLVLHLEECRSQIIILENELNATRIASEQWRLQVEAGNKSLIQKTMDLSEASQRILSMKDKIMELCQKAQDLKLEIDEDKMVREELEKKITLLLESNVCKDKEILCIQETSKLLEGKFDKLQEEAEEFRTRDRFLTSEMEKKSDEIKLCEQEIVTLSIDAQVSTVNAAILEEKLMEMISACESLKIGAIIQREMLDMEMIKVHGNLDGLKKELDDLKGENTKLQGDLKAYMPLATHLLDSVSSLEQRILLLKELSATSSRVKEDNPLMSCITDNSSEGFRTECQTTEPNGMLELQESLDRIEGLQRVISETTVLLEKKMINASANTEAEMTEAHKELKANKDCIQLIDDGEPVINLKSHEDDAEVSKPKHDQVMKDIQLDKVSSSSLYGNGGGSYTLSRVNNAETDDQMLELWETAERDCNHQMRKESSATIEQDIEYHEIEAVEEETSEYPSSELMAEKELSIDKLELHSRQPESHQEWKTKVTEKLLRDAQRLSALQTGVQEVKRKLGTSEKSKHSSSFKYDTLTVHLKEVEEAVVKLTDSTNKLIKKSDTHSNHAGREEEGIHSPGGRQLVQRGRRASEKIGRLELELQKLQYIMLKLEEEHGNRRRTTSLERKSSVLLRDYLYGRREGNKNRRALCWCMRPKTNGD